MARSSNLTPFIRNVCTSCLRQRSVQRHFSTTIPIQDDSHSSHLPRIAQPSLWSSLVPKFLRSRSSSSPTAKSKKEWNPATIFIVLGLLVGSNAIQMIALRREMLNFSRQTDARLAALREVVQKVKNGEPVDVKRMLGTGDERHEAEWEEVVKELESTDMLWEDKLRRDRRLAEMEEQKKGKRELQQAEERERERKRQKVEGGTGQNQENEVRKPRFLM